MAKDLPLLSEVLTKMGPIEDGDNSIAENFALRFDLTRTWISALNALYDNGTEVSPGFTLPTEAEIKASIAQRYGTTAYQNALSPDDLDAATNPGDMANVKLPYIDGSSNYVLNINDAAKTWELQYRQNELVHAILKGNISQTLQHVSHLDGDPVGDAAMIEFPVGQLGATGVRLVHEDGVGILRFDVNLIPRVVATGGPLLKIPNFEVVNEILN